MKSIWYFPVIFIGLSVVYLIALALQKTFLVPLTGISHLLDGLVFIWIALKLNKAMREDGAKDLSQKYFMGFFASTGIFQVLMGLPHFLLYKSSELFPQAMAWAYIDGHIFLYLALALTISVPLQLYFPSQQKLKTLIFSFFLIFGTVITFLNILNPNTPVFDANSGITFLNASPLIGKLIPIIAILSWVPAGVIFIYKGIKARHDRLVFVRSMLLGVGLLMLVVFGPLHDIATTASQYLVADIFTMVGFLTMASGVFYQQKPVEEELGATY